MRRLGQALSVITGLIAIAVVAVAWLQDPEPITASEAAEQAALALEEAGVDGAVVGPDPSAGTFDPEDRDPISVWKTVATLEGGTVSLWLAQDDGEPVFLDDRSPSGTTQLLSDEQFAALADHDPDALGELMRRNVAITIAAVAIAILVALLTGLLGRPPHDTQEQLA